MHIICIMQHNLCIIYATYYMQHCEVFTRAICIRPTDVREDKNHICIMGRVEQGLFKNKK